MPAEDVTRDQIALLQAGVESGRIDPDAVFRDQAIRETADEKYGIEKIVTLGSLATAVAFTFSPWFAGAVGLYVVGKVWGQFKEGDQAIADIGRGNIAPYLKPEARQTYEQLIDSKRKLLGTSHDEAPAASTSTTSTPNPAATPVEVEQPTLAAATVPDRVMGADLPDTAPATDGSPVSFSPVEQLKAIADPKARLLRFCEMAAYDGFPIGTLAKKTWVWCYGPSQSGKSTISHLLSIVRIMRGFTVGYYSVDEDYPAAVAWATAELTPGSYKSGLATVAEAFQSADKGQLDGMSWTFDEVYRAVYDYGVDADPLAVRVCSKGTKARGCIIWITHNDNLKENGIESVSRASLDSKRVLIEAILGESAEGDDKPSGKYEVTRNGSSSIWTLPEWLGGDERDPVDVMLEIFPEAIASASPASAQPPSPATIVRSSNFDRDDDFKAQPREEVSDVFTAAVEAIALNTDDVLGLAGNNRPGAERIARYLAENRLGKTVTVRDVADNRLNRELGLGTTEAAREMLELMVYLGICSPSETADTYQVAGHA